MTALTRTTPAFTRFAALAARAADRVVATGQAVLKAWSNRNALIRLSACSDAELSDMGITRGDLFDASGSRWHEDPTRRLCAIRGERASAIEMAARRVC